MNFDGLAVAGQFARVPGTTISILTPPVFETLIEITSLLRIHVNFASLPGRFERLPAISRLLLELVDTLSIERVGHSLTITLPQPSFIKLILILHF